MVLSNGFFYERIQLDTINERFNKVPTAKEGDANGRGMIVVLTENGLVKNTTGVSLLFKWEHTRITGAQGLEDFEPLDLTKGEYIVTYPTEMNHEGYVKAEIRIIDNGKYAGSRNMKIQVEPSVGDDTAMESSNQFSALVTALLEVNSWNARIDAVEADFIQRANDVEATYPQELLSLGSQLADIDAQVDLLNRGLGETFATLTDLQTAYPTGDTKDHIVGADGHRYFWNETSVSWADGGAYQAIEIVDGTVTADKTSFISEYKYNLLDDTKMVTGYYLDIETGVTISNASYLTSPFIPIAELTKYRVAETINQCFYDSDKSFISGANGKAGVIDTVANSSFVRFDIAKTDYDSLAIPLMVVRANEYELYPSVYIPYTFHSLKYKDEAFKDLIDNIITEKLANNPINPNETSFLKSTRINFLDLTKLLEGYLNSGVFSPNASYYTSDYISVVPGEPWKVFQCMNVVFYDTNKVLISYVAIGGGDTITIPSTANIAYMRFDFSTTILSNNPMAVKGVSYPTQYIPYSFEKVEWATQEIATDLGVVNKLKGLKWNNIGDSIANWSNGYKVLIPEQTGIIMQNYAVDGGTYAPKTDSPLVISTSYVNMTDDADIITVHAGVNDVSGGIAIGTMADRTNATFMGSLHITYAGLIDKYVGKKIGIITPIQRISNSYLVPYVDAIKQVATFYGIPCLDLNATCGLYPDNPKVKDAYIPDGLHPNQAGHRIFMPKIITFLESL